jgi:hypothetical protein
MRSWFCVSYTELLGSVLVVLNMSDQIDVISRGTRFESRHIER